MFDKRFHSLTAAILFLEAGLCVGLFVLPPRDSGSWPFLAFAVVLLVMCVVRERAKRREDAMKEKGE
jgi:hypothetical protein